MQEESVSGRHDDGSFCRVDERLNRCPKALVLVKNDVNLKTMPAGANIRFYSFSHTWIYISNYIFRLPLRRE